RHFEPATSVRKPSREPLGARRRAADDRHLVTLFDEGGRQLRMPPADVEQARAVAERAQELQSGAGLKPEKPGADRSREAPRVILRRGLDVGGLWESVAHQAPPNRRSSRP